MPVAVQKRNRGLWDGIFIFDPKLSHSLPNHHAQKSRCSPALAVTTPSQSVALTPAHIEPPATAAIVFTCSRSSLGIARFSVNELGGGAVSIKREITRVGESCLFASPTLIRNVHEITWAFDSPHPSPLQQEREPVAEVISCAFLSDAPSTNALAIFSESCSSTNCGSFIQFKIIFFHTLKERNWCNIFKDSTISMRYSHPLK